MKHLSIFKKTPLLLMCSAFLLYGCNTADSTQYTLSGTITSTTVDVGGLVLTDGIGNTVTLSSNTTSFSFNNGNAYLYLNTTYHVSIQQQPIGARCTITNSTGTPNSNNGNISNVAITCSKPASVQTSSATLAGTNTGIVIDNNGNQYVANNGKLVNLTTGPTPVTLTNAIPGFQITSIALNSTGTAIYASSGTAVEKITLPTTDKPNTYTVTSWAGSSTAGTINGNGASAAFSNIQGLAVDSSENVYVRDAGTSMSIRKIDIGGNVTTLAGSGQIAHVDGTGVAASFDFSDANNAASNPATAITVTNNNTVTNIVVTSGITIDSSGNLYVVEGGNNNDVRRITPSGIVGTLAGSTTTFDYIDKVGSAASFANPYAITIDSNSNLYVIDGNNAIRIVTHNGGVSTFISQGTSTPFSNGTPPKTITNTGTYGPFYAITTDSSGNIYATNSDASGSIFKVSF